MVPDYGTGGISTPSIDHDEFERSLQPGKMIEKTLYACLFVQHRGDDGDQQGYTPGNIQIFLTSGVDFPSMKFEPGPWMTTGTGIFLLGVAWLLFWLGPAFHLYEADPRWAHNFAFALIFIIVGIAYFRPSLSTGMISLVASFITIPTELAYWSGMVATLMETVLLAAIIVVVAAEWQLKRPLLAAGPKAGFWLKIHLPVLSYIGIAHMPFIFFMVRWVSSAPYLTYLPVEHEYSTTIFNAMVLILVVFAIAGHYGKEVRGFSIQRAGFYWAVLMLLVPLASIGIFGQ
jgi:hypothetical protein